MGWLFALYIHLLFWFAFAFGLTLGLSQHYENEKLKFLFNVLHKHHNTKIFGKLNSKCRKNLKKKI